MELDAVDLGTGGDRAGGVVPEVNEKGRQRVESRAARVGGGDLPHADAVDPVDFEDADGVAAVPASRPHVRLVPATEGEADLAAHQTRVEPLLKQEHPELRVASLRHGDQLAAITKRQPADAGPAPLEVAAQLDDRSIVVM